MLMAETMISAGIPRDKMFTHCGADWGSQPKDAMWNSAEAGVIQQVLLLLPMLLLLLLIFLLFLLLLVLLQQLLLMMVMMLPMLLTTSVEGTTGLVIL
jgi:hypothetical protein